ncbi:MAG: ATP-binding cassette domain-containing protein [Candidatus Thorarchaeota archaeon]|jgi:peptide/nickel transport system ATP-binding protein
MVTNEEIQTETDSSLALDADLLLDIRGLKTSFYTYEGVVKALDGITVQLKKGDTLAFVGETGCGKSVTAKSVMRLVDSPGRIEAGEVIFRHKKLDGTEEIVDLLKLSGEEMRQIRGNRIGIVFQESSR